jgi:predicted RNA-binding protein with RPS1 domain
MEAHHKVGRKLTSVKVIDVDEQGNVVMDVKNEKRRP